jgi:SNF2 family DNA or RNA helicase
VANHNAIDAVKDVPRVPELGDVLFDAIVIDESHMVLPIRDTRKLTQFWKGLRHIRRTEDCIRIAVSGTPDRGKLENRYGTWRFLDRENTSQNRWDWLEQNFHMYDQKVSYNRTVKMVGHLKNRDRWVKKDQELVIRRTKQEVLAELPAKRYVDVEIPMSKEQLKGYYELKEQAEKEEMNPMVFATRARQWATCSWADLDGVYTPQYKGGSNKLDWLLEWLDSRGYMDGVNEGKVVISSQFSQVLHWLRAELENKGLNVGLLDGSTAQNLRIEQQRKFQEPNRDLSIMLLSGHMGVGITLDIADDLIMFDVPYDPDKIEQIEDRVHRASNMHKVTITTLISRATIDQPIMNKVTKRYKITRDLLDGERGIDFERRVVDDVINVPAGV